MLIPGYARENALLFLVANKVDDTQNRVVTTEEGRALAQNLGFTQYFETSAKDNYNVEEMMLSVAKACFEAGIMDTVHGGN